jgi:hypothetical protein
MALFLVGSPVGTLSNATCFWNLSGGVSVSAAIVVQNATKQREESISARLKSNKHGGRE